MKFAIAAAILAKTIPEIASEQISPSVLGGQQSHHHFQQPKLVNKIKTFKAAAELLKNDPELTAGLMKSCDPLSDDLDVGALSCASGYECIEDEASILGGFCMSTFRELEEPSIYCDVCGYGMGMNWDIAEFQPVILPVTGDEVTCLDIGASAYSEPIFTATTCPVFRSTAIAAGCCFPYECTNICGDKRFLPYALMPTGDNAAYCLGVVPNIDVADCASLAGAVVPFCCEESVEVPTGTPPVGVPSQAPIMSPALGAPTVVIVQSPASEAVWMRSTQTLVSTMGLVAMITSVMLLK